MKKLVLIATVFLCGCSSSNMSPPMTNAQIIKATKECESAGLRPVELVEVSGFIPQSDGIIRGIQCQPKDSKL